MSQSSEAESNSAKPQNGFVSSYKSVFMSGLATILPTVLTFWVLTSGYSFVDENVATPINSLLKNRIILGTDEGLKFAKDFWDIPQPLPSSRSKQNRTYSEVAQDEERLQDYTVIVEQRYPTWIGFVLAVALIFVIGFFTASFIGRTVWGLVEGSILRIPIVKSVYPAAKQMVEFLFTNNDDQAAQFNAVVCIEYPNVGQWTLGLVTGEGRPEIRNKEEQEVVTVFIPFAPTPISGFVVFANKADCIAIDMSVDEAFKFYISGGVIGSMPGPIPISKPESPKE
ncbi:MAG: DUF502 domain-containing protein [Planctomycetota bacterium]|nr:DUF502 domain-containing protein [Planctomycetota bacterium]